MTEEVIIPLPDRIEPTTKARGMMITNSILMLRERGLFDRWREHATRAEEIPSVTAGSWVPIDLAEAHYLACDKMGLTEDEQVDLGHQAGLRTRGAVLASIAKVARAMGVEAWSAFKQYPRAWARMYVGGAVGVTRLGHKDARIDVAGFTLAYIPYMRRGFRGTNKAGFELFSKKVEMRELSSSKDAFSIRVTWT